MKYEAVIFDLDGTLVHSLPEHRYLVVGNTISELGGRYSQKGIDSFWFETDRNSVIREFFRLNPEEFWPIYRKNDKSEIRAKFTKPYDDINVVSQIKNKRIKTGIVTNAPPHILSLEVGMIGQENFDAIVSAHTLNGINPKPDPQGLEECLSLLGISKKRAVFVGNSDEDIQTARNTGVLDVLIDRKEYTFSNIKPTITLYSLRGLKGILEI